MIKKNLSGFQLSTGRYDEFVESILGLAAERKSSYTCVANVHMFIEAYKDSAYNTIINDANVVTPDGIPLCWYLKLKYGIKQERVAGMDLLPDLLTEMENRNLSVFFYGGTETMLSQTENFVSRNYPRLSIAGMHSPPFRQLNSAEEELIVNTINQSGANLIFVILGCPRQEKWMASMKGRIKATMVAVGGALPVMIGQQKRAPRWMQRNGLEWLYRLLQEPGRLFKRYAVTNSYFLYLLMKDFTKGIFLRKQIKQTA